MANRQSTSTGLKMTRGRKILALVPKIRAKSDDESCESSEDEVKLYKPHPDEFDGSSPVRSLPSSIENLNIFSDSDDCEYREVYTFAEIHDKPRSQHVALDSTPNSPSIIQNYSDIIPSSPIAYVAPSPSIQTAPSPSVQVAPSPSVFIAASPSINSISSPATITATDARRRVGRAKKTRVVIKKTIVKPIKLTPKWRKVRFLGTAEIYDSSFILSDNRKSPLDYFKLFFSDDIIDWIVHHTNLYSVQKKGSSINVTIDEIKDFLAINILMGIVDMPAYTDYWSNDLKYSKIAEVMTLKRFQAIRRYIHFNDNMEDDGDRYYKIRPLVEKVRRNCAFNISEGKKFSIDEMMVPYKGTRAAYFHYKRQVQKLYKKSNKVLLP